MNRLRRSGLLVVFTVALMAPNSDAWADEGAPGAAAAPASDRLTPSQLEDLLGPIALYPDTLLANVLAASVYPNEVAEAAAGVKGGLSSDQIDAKSWEAPVKAVAHVPDAIKMLGQYPDWTVALGQAYLVQAKDVMDVVQSLRKKAQANGALQDSPQQKVVVQQDTIYVQSADPQVVYVPTYQPTVVYADDNSNAVAAGAVGFGVGVATGLLLANMDCDYHYGCVSYGYHGGGYNNVNVNNVNINTGNINTGNINTGNINTGNVNTGNINTGNVNTGNMSRTNVNSGNINNASKPYAAPVGQEGNAWKPNQNKPLATQQPSQYASAANTAAAAGRYPASTSKGAAATRQSTGAPGTSERQMPASRPATTSGVPANRPPSQFQGGGGASRPTSGGYPSMERPSSASQRPSSGSAFSGGAGSSGASQRGAQSRGGGGGGGRGGGGRR